MARGAVSESLGRALCTVGIVGALLALAEAFWRTRRVGCRAVSGVCSRRTASGVSKFWRASETSASANLRLNGE